MLGRIAIAVAILGGCSKPAATTSDAPPTISDSAAGSDAVSAPTGLAPTVFSINWPTKSVAMPMTNNPWPTAVMSDYGSLRTWGSDVDWARVEPALMNGMPCDPQVDNSPCWVWGELDQMLADTHALGIDTLHFVTANYPSWSNGNMSSAVLPTDVGDTMTICSRIPDAFRAAAGLSAGDCYYQEFVFALAMHVCPTCSNANGPWQGRLAIRSFSPGNEVNGMGFVMPPCSATATTPCDDIARMSSDLYKIIKYIDPTAIVGTPSFTQVGGDVAMGHYLQRAAATYGTIADVEIFHIYGQAGEIEAGIPELSWSTRIAAFAALRTAANGLDGVPMWVDEGGWGQNFQTYSAGQACAATMCGCLATPLSWCMDANNVSTNETIDNMPTAPPAGYLVRGYLEMIASGVDRFYWFGPGADEWGSFADCTGGVGCTNQWTPAAYAWHSMYQWLVGATMGTLTQSGTQYTYPITDKDGARPTGCSGAITTSYHGLIAWDTMATPTLDCGGFTHYCTLFENATSPFTSGTAHPCNGSVTLGPNPILLE